ncbi:MAG: AzlC family ABC transporter permease [Actinomycetes bacterium]
MSQSHDGTDTAGGTTWPARRPAVLRDAGGIAVATGAYALSFGALSSAAGLSLAQTCVLSLVMFTGASQFALIGVLGGGGGGPAAVGTAVLLGTRNSLYGLRLAPLLGVRGLRRLVAAQFVIDETTAMATRTEDEREGRYAFWATALLLYVLWNAGTLVGALGASSLSDPGVLGLDAAVPAAFLALLAPRMRGREPWVVALVAAAVAVLAVPVTPVGVPVLLAAAVASALGLMSGWGGSTPEAESDDAGRQAGPGGSERGSERGSG